MTQTKHGRRLRNNGLHFQSPVTVLHYRRCSSKKAPGFSQGMNCCAVDFFCHRGIGIIRSLENQRDEVPVRKLPGKIFVCPRHWRTD
jgi:hypothetical protein